MLKTKIHLNIKLMAVIITFLIGLVAALSLAPKLPVNAANTQLVYDGTNILDDLCSSPDFNIAKYPFDSTGLIEPKIINVVEYCYSFKANMRDNFGLYVYFYNPQGLDFNYISASNKIQLAITFNDDGSPADYAKFSLKFCSRSTENNNFGLFYKFRVVDKLVNGKSILDRINASVTSQQSSGIAVENIVRRYDISGVELLQKDKSNAKEYTVGGTYVFKGFAKGYGADPLANSTLTSIVNELETVKLEVKSTNYRTGVSAAGKNHQNELNSVYFSVPERFFTEYGKLQKIKAEWWEYKTEPIVITARQSVYNSFLPFVGKDIGRHNKDVPLRMYSDYLASISTCTYKDGFNIANMSGSDTNYVSNVISKIPLWFYESSDDLSGFTLGKERLSDYIYNYTSNYTSETIDCNGRNISADLFSNNVESGRTRGYNVKEIDTDDKFDMLSYDSSHSGWDKFWEYFGNWGIETGGDYYGVSPICEVTPDDLKGENLSNKFFVNSTALQDFKNYVNNAKAEGKRTVLFRFAQTDYFSTMYFIEKDGDIVVGKQHGILAQQTVFLDFDILTLTFNKEGKHMVIPAVSSPIDIINAVTPPLDIINGCNMNLNTLLGLVIGVILFIVLFSWIIKLLIWLLRLPIRFIVWLFKPKGAKK